MIDKKGKKRQRKVPCSAGVQKSAMRLSTRLGALAHSSRQLVGYSMLSFIMLSSSVPQ